MDFGKLASPPSPPELPDQAARWPRWPWWFAVAGFGVALLGTIIVGGVIAAVLGYDEDPPSGFVLVSTLLQSIIFLATAYLFARRVARPRAWHFGLRATAPWPALGWAALAMVVFFVLSAVYGAAVDPDAEQDVVEALGGDSGTLGMVLAGLMIVGVAPYAEEIFFRGFFYRSLRTRLATGWAASANGLVFGLLHFSFNGLEGLLLIVPLGLLGVLFCLVFERTASLFPPIAMHAFNNALAYGVAGGDHSWIVSLAVGPLVIASCFLLPRLLPRVPAPKPAIAAPALGSPEPR